MVTHLTPDQSRPELLRDVVSAVGVLEGEEELVVGESVVTDGFWAAFLAALPVQVKVIAEEVLGRNEMIFTSTN